MKIAKPFKWLLIACGTVACFYAAIALMITILFGPDAWTLSDRMKEREIELSNKSPQFFEVLIEISKAIIEENKDNPRFVLYHDSTDRPIPSAFKELKPEGLRVYGETVMIYLEKMMDTAALLLIKKEGNHYIVYGEFGDPGHNYKTIQYYRQNAENEQIASHNSGKPPREALTLEESK